MTTILLLPALLVATASTSDQLLNRAEQQIARADLLGALETLRETPGSDAVEDRARRMRAQALPLVAVDRAAQAFEALVEALQLDPTGHVPEAFLTSEVASLAECADRYVSAGPPSELRHALERWLSNEPGESLDAKLSGRLRRSPDLACPWYVRSSAMRSSWPVYGSIGAAALGLGAGVTLSILAESSRQDQRGPLTPDAYAKLDTRRRAELAAGYVSYGVAIAGAAAALGLLIYQHVAGEEDVGLHVAPSPGGASLSLELP